MAKTYVPEPGRLQRIRYLVSNLSGLATVSGDLFSYPVFGSTLGTVNLMHMNGMHVLTAGPLKLWLSQVHLNYLGSSTNSTDFTSLSCICPCHSCLRLWTVCVGRSVNNSKQHEQKHHMKWASPNYTYTLWTPDPPFTAGSQQTPAGSS